jgi:glutamate/tyrosine decarboxylase-like PLP-dependent enzyme
MPREGIGFDAAYADLARDVLPYPTGNIHPRFWGWVHGSGVPSAVLAELVAATMNSNAWNYDQAPVFVELAVLGWMKEMIGFPAESTGLLVSGGSMGNLIGLTVARNALGGPGVREHGLAGHTARLVVYASNEVHSSVRKAVELLGLGERSLLRIPARDDYTFDVAALERRIAEDRARGHRPIAIVASAGTVNTGAIDPLGTLADLAAREQLWLHVDAAIGAPARLTAAGRALLAGLERADSVAFDLHKWLYIPYECGVVLVRDGAAHRASFEVAPSYLGKLDGGLAKDGFPFADHGMQLSRGFRALKVWLALRAHGTDAFAAAIERNLAQAQRLAALVDAHPKLERLAPVPLNVVNYRYAAPGFAAATLDALNKRLLVRLQEDGIAVPSSTVLGGRFAIRVAITNHRSRDDDFELLVRESARIGDALATGA